MLNLHYHEIFMNFALRCTLCILYNYSMFAPLYSIYCLALKRLIKHVFPDKEFNIQSIIYISPFSAGPDSLYVL